MNRQSRFLGVILVASLFVIWGLPPAFAAYPDKPVEFVVHNPPGGGSDLFARGITDILTREKIVTAPVLVMNKPGGAGAVATSYVQQKKGNPYSILTATTSVYATMVKRNIGLDDFTALCRMVVDPSVILVNPSSPYKDITELVAAAKKTRKSVKLGIANIGGTDHMVAALLQKATGAEFNLISHKSGGDAVTALLGGHLDFTITNPGEAAGLIEAGKLRVLATSMDKRLPFYPNVPTFKEKGIDAVFMAVRGFFLPKDVAPEVVTYWLGAFDKLRKTNEWKEFVKHDYLVDAFLGGADYKSWLTGEFTMYEKILKEIDDQQK
jgi:putative tricarboxylic transport membrane protein